MGDGGDGGGDVHVSGARLGQTDAVSAGIGGAVREDSGEGGGEGDDEVDGR